MKQLSNRHSIIFIYLLSIFSLKNAYGLPLNDDIENIIGKCFNEKRVVYESVYEFRQEHEKGKLSYFIRDIEKIHRRNLRIQGILDRLYHLCNSDSYRFFAEWIKNPLSEDIAIINVDIRSDDNFFTNSFSKSTWIISNNYRTNKNVDYYASDVAILQYHIASKIGHFKHFLPSRIITSRVYNDETHQYFKELCSRNGFIQQKFCSVSEQELIYGFLNKTPNGKSERRMIDTIGLKADKIEIINNDDVLDVILYVSPNQNIIQKLKIAPKPKIDLRNLILKRNETQPVLRKKPPIPPKPVYLRK